MKRLTLAQVAVFFLLAFGPGERAVRADEPSRCRKIASAAIDGLKRLNTEARIYRGALLKDYQPEAYAIFERTRLDPARALSASEEATLRTYDLLQPHEQWRRSHQLIKRLNVAFATGYRSEVKKDSTSMARKVTEFLFPIRELTPNLSPLWSKLGFETTQRLVKKVLENPEADLSESELIFLKDVGKLRDFLRFQADLKNGLRDGFLTASTIKASGRALTWSAAGSAALLSLVGEDEITRSESVSRDSPKGMNPIEDKVELIFLSPFPDAAVRIGNQIYHPGFLVHERLSVKALREGKALPGNHIRVELRLSEDERAHLRDQLEENVNRSSVSLPPWVTSISQANQAIARATGIEVPPVLDRTQSGTLSYLKLIKALGNKKIGDIRFAGSSDASLKKERIAESAASLAEGLIFFHYAGSIILYDLATGAYKLLSP